MTHKESRAAKQDLIDRESSRISVALSALDTFAPGVKLYMGRRELRMSWDIRLTIPPRHDFPARLRTKGDIPEFGQEVFPGGGTSLQALGQLIRFIRDLPRLPIDTWKYWSGSKVQLCTPHTVELLVGAGWDADGKTTCVLCGSVKFKGGLDWWGLDGVTGPCCSGGRCMGRAKS